MRKEKEAASDISPTQRAMEQSVLQFSKKMLKTSLIVSVLERNGSDGLLWKIRSSRIASFSIPRS